MRSRYALAAVMLPLLAAILASASILSATGQSFATRSPNVAPEPSTWMLLVAGLALMGRYVMIRRRPAMDV